MLPRSTVFTLPLMKSTRSTIHVAVHTVLTLEYSTVAHLIDKPRFRLDDDPSAEGTVSVGLLGTLRVLCLMTTSEYKQGIYFLLFTWCPTLPTLRLIERRFSRGGALHARSGC